MKTRSGRTVKAKAVASAVKKTKKAIKKVTKEVKDVKQAVAKAKKVVTKAAAVAKAAPKAAPSSSAQTEKGKKSWNCGTVGAKRQKTRKVKGRGKVTFEVRCGTQTKAGKTRSQKWRNSSGYKDKYMGRPWRGTKSPTTWNK